MFDIFAVLVDFVAVCKYLSVFVSSCIRLAVATVLASSSGTYIGRHFGS